MLGYKGYINLSDGQHSVKVNDPSEITIRAKNGRITRIYIDEVDFKKSNSYHGRYVACIVGHKTTRKRKVIEENRYGILGGGFFKDKDIYIPYANKTWTGVHGEIIKRLEIFGQGGICKTRFSRGSFLGQRFIYSNGFTAYSFTKKDRGYKICYPNGKLAYEYHSDTEIGAVVKEDKWHRIRQGNPYFIKNGREDHSFTLYDRRGRIKEQGEYKDRQQTGKWIVNYRDQFWLSGLLVDKKLYETKPEQINPRVILRHHNAQFRAMMLKKVGLERVVKECGGKLIDRDEKNDYALYDFDLKADKDEDQIDRVLRVLMLTCPSTKMKYYLRIPANPRFDTCYKARQGTFNGFDPDAKPVDFALET
jgi:hypothetical protein